MDYNTCAFGVVMGTHVSFMLAGETGRMAFNREGWWFQVKHNGHRLAIRKENGRAILQTRPGTVVSDDYPHIAQAALALPIGTFILDGELVVTDSHGFERPNLVRNRWGRRRAKFYVFDLLECDGNDLRFRPLVERDALLQALFAHAPPDSPLQYVRHFEGQGVLVFREVCAHGFEGVIAKRVGSFYKAGRSRDWVKFVCSRTAIPKGP